MTKFCSRKLYEDERLYNLTFYLYKIDNYFMKSALFLTLLKPETQFVHSCGLKTKNMCTMKESKRICLCFGSQQKQCEEGEHSEVIQRKWNLLFTGEVQI